MIDLYGLFVAYTGFLHSTEILQSNTFIGVSLRIERIYVYRRIQYLQCLIKLVHFYQQKTLVSSCIHNLGISLDR